MARQCERPDCAARAAVAYGFDAARRSAWFADLVSVGDDAMAGALCAAHARAMVLPRGWWLDDRRGTQDGTLFTAGPDGAPNAPAQAGGKLPVGREPGRRPARIRRRRGGDGDASWQEVQLPLALVAEPVGTAGGPADRDVEHAGARDAGDGGVAPGDGHVRPEPADDEESDEPAPDAVVVQWRPRFDQADDLGGVLAARSPLLARAFGGRRRSAPPAPERD